VLRLIYPPFATGRTSVALLVLRVFAGVALTLHGLKKAKDPFHWMDGSPDAAIGPLQFMAVVAEVGGGICLALGFLTPLWCVLILSTMGVAIHKHVGEGGAFVGGKGAWELAGMHAIISLTALIAGPGRWSVDFFLFGRRRGEAPPT
jgi:uncharacterized membrane protein YphA (DoxX/SURF4 family)